MENKIYESAKEIFGEGDKPLTVNSNKKYITVNSKTVSIKTEEDVMALELAEKLGDKKSYNYFLLLAKHNSHNELREALSYTLMAEREGRIKTIKAVYFIGIIRKWGLRVNFKKDG